MRISDWSSDVCSSDLLRWLERTPDKREVGGSSPPRPTTDVARNTGFGALAQLGERLLCKHQVIGSIPIGSTIAAHRLCRARRDHQDTPEMKTSVDRKSTRLNSSN